MSFKRVILNAIVSVLALLALMSCRAPLDDKIGKPYEYYDEENDMFFSVDEYGREIKRIVYGMEGSEKIEFERITYDYNQNGDIVREDYYGRSIHKCYIIYEYDADNKLERKSKYSAEGYPERVWCDYSEDVYGELISLKNIYYYENGGGVYYYIERKINSQDTKSVYYDPDGSVSKIEEKIYDANGNLTDSVIYDADGNILSYTKREYDDRARLIKDTCNNASGNQSIRQINYYDNGKEREIVWYYDGVISYIKRFNESGANIEDIRYFYQNGVMVQRDERYRNHSGKITKEVYYNIQTVDEVGGVLLEKEYFDKGGGIQKQACYDENGTPVYINEYVAADLPLSFVTYNKNGTVGQRTEWKYDKIVKINTDIWQGYNGGPKQHSKTEVVDYVLLERIEYQYDDAGNVIQVTKYGKEDNVIE